MVHRGGASIALLISSIDGLWLAGFRQPAGAGGLPAPLLFLTGEPHLGSDFNTAPPGVEIVPASGVAR